VRLFLWNSQQALGCTILTISLHQGEGLTIPAILQGRRLHIQMPINAHRFLLGVTAQLAQQNGRKWYLRAIRELAGEQWRTASLIKSEFTAAIIKYAWCFFIFVINQPLLYSLSSYCAAESLIRFYFLGI
jgi:hypothetical protein